LASSLSGTRGMYFGGLVSFQNLSHVTGHIPCLPVYGMSQAARYKTRTYRVVHKLQIADYGAFVPQPVFRPMGVMVAERPIRNCGTTAAAIASLSFAYQPPGIVTAFPTEQRWSISIGASAVLTLRSLGIANLCCGRFCPPGSIRLAVRYATTTPPRPASQFYRLCTT
jgi:hypothetical protein